ncbi:MAG: SpoIID/LytB domain-containing protein [Patescibacteria group bacterium]
MLPITQKNLSYFWNEELKDKLKENKLYQTAKTDGSSLNVFGHILFSFLLVIAVAWSLHFVEAGWQKAENSPLSAKVVLAGENIWPAQIKSQSITSYQLKPGETVSLKLEIVNNGTNKWLAGNTNLKALTTAFKYQHASWIDLYVPTKMKEAEVLPGETATFEIILAAPKKTGSFTGEFTLTQNNVSILQKDISVNLVSTETPNNNPTTTTTQNIISTIKPKLNVCSLKLNFSIASVSDTLDNLTCVNVFNFPANGPEIRVGIFHTDKAITLKNSSAWQIVDEKDNFVASIPAEQEIKIFYNTDAKQYAFDFIDRTIRTAGTNLKLVNFNNGIFTVTSYQDLALWNKAINYNQFRGNIDLGFYNDKDRLWLINRIPLEDYLKGIKETSEPDPVEYQKAMTIAARTYALYHINRYKVENSFFDLYNDERSQVYKGYVAETIMKKQVGVVTETNGVVLTYGDSVIIAYYSARSGGQTVSKNIPYLKSVSTPYSQPLGKNGHGLGIDAYDAKARAQKDGWTFDQILRYYYNNIYLEEIY